MSILNAFKINGVILVCISYGFIKLIDYGQLFWLDDYLINVVHVETDPSSIVSLGYIGYSVGMIILGWLSDKTGTRALMIPFVLLVTSFMYIFIYFYESQSVAFWYIAVIGSMTLLSGPQVIVAGPLI